MSTAVVRRVHDGEAYLCARESVERRWVQPLRLAGALVAAPLVVYAATQLPRQRKGLRAATVATGIGVGVVSLWIWRLAHAAMRP